MDILALDIAGNTGVAEGHAGETPRVYSVKFNKREDDDHTEVFARGLEWVAQRLLISKPDVIAIERPSGFAMQGRTNANSLAITYGLYATISAACTLKGRKPRVISVSTVRKSFIGVGNMPSSAAKRQVKATCRLLGWDAPDDDAADAAALWHHLCLLLAPQQAHIVDPLFLKRGRAWASALKT